MPDELQTYMQNQALQSFREKALEESKGRENAERQLRTVQKELELTKATLGASVKSQLSERNRSSIRYAAADYNLPSNSAESSRTIADLQGKVSEQSQALIELELAKLESDTEARHLRAELIATTEALNRAEAANSQQRDGLKQLERQLADELEAKRKIHNRAREVEAELAATQRSLHSLQGTQDEQTLVSADYKVSEFNFVLTLY